MNEITFAASRHARALVQKAAPFLMLATMIGISATRARAQDAPAASPRSFVVDVSGSGAPMILIPGLASPGRIWESTLARFGGEYETHVLTLAGFAGQAPIDEEPVLERVLDELVRYIREGELERPVIVGHSLGGFLALWLASSEPDLVGPVVAVDALPFLPAVFQGPQATPESMRPQAEAMRIQMASPTPEGFAQGQQAMLRTMITDTALADRVAGWTSKSDPGTVAQAMYELFTIDLRPELPEIRSPVLVYGSWVAYGARDQILANFEREFAAVPDVEIVLSETGRHFLMYDDPEGLHGAMAAFLSRARANQP